MHEAARCSHGDVHVQMLLPLFEQLLRLFYFTFFIKAFLTFTYKLEIKKKKKREDTHKRLNSTNRKTQS